MSDEATNPTVSASNETVESTESRAAVPVASNKGKGKATQDTADDDEDEEEDKEFDPDRMDESQEVEGGGADSDDEEDDEDFEVGDESDEDDDSIEADEVDPSNIESYGIGNRPRRARKEIDYSSEEALKKAGLDAASSEQ